MKDLEHRSQSLGTKSVSHRPIFLIFFFLFFFFFLLVCTGPKYLYWPKQPDFAGMASIFSSTKQGIYLYQGIGWYGIYWSYRPVRYGIDFLDFDWLDTQFCQGPHYNRGQSTDSWAHRRIKNPPNKIKDLSAH